MLKLFKNCVGVYGHTSLLLFLLASPIMAEDKLPEAKDKEVVAVQEESAPDGEGYEETDILEEELPIIEEGGDNTPGLDGHLKGEVSERRGEPKKQEK